MLKVDYILFSDQKGNTLKINQNEIESFPITGGEEAQLINNRAWNQHGETHINSLIEPYEGEIIFIIRTANKNSLEIAAARQEITNICNPLNGTVKMSISLNNGLIYNRDIVFLTAPFFPIGFTNRNRDWQKVQLTYVANNPFWYSEIEIIENFRAADPLFTFPFSSELPDTPTKPIVEVTNLTDSVQLSWTATHNTTMYKLYRSQDIDTLGSKITDINNVNETSYIDDTAIGGEIYYYTVKAVNVISDTKEKATNSDKMIAEPKLIKPSKPSLTVNDYTGSCRLDWRVTDNTTSYKIFRSDSKDKLGSQLIEITDINTVTYTDNTAIGGEIYYYTVKAVNLNKNTGVDIGTNSDKTVGKPYTIQVYGNKTVDFNNWAAWTVYGAAQVTADFGNEVSVKENDRIKIDSNGQLRWYLPQGQLGTANTGGLIRAKIAAKNDLTFEYDIKFDPDFPWSKGGKIPGISGGKGYTGGKSPAAGDGWSVRIMWREGGRLIPYVYHYRQKGTYGDTFGKTLGYAIAGQTHRIKYYLVLNTADNKDGILKIYLDGNLVLEKRDITFRTDDSKIDTAHLSIFAGGSTEDWNMTADGYIRLDNILWK